MSTNVNVVCEDPLHDQHVAVPVLKAMFSDRLGRKQARVQAVLNPRIRGIDDLLRQVEPLARRYAPLSLGKGRARLVELSLAKG